MNDDILGFRDEYRFLSNFEPCLVYLEGVGYASVEHAYQAAKTLDPTERAAIRSARHSALAKSLGARVTKRYDWDEIKEQVMLDLNRQKYQTSPYKEKLLATSGRYIEETNYWKDTFWGVCDGVGLNKLGHILMQIREEIRADVSC